MCLDYFDQTIEGHCLQPIENDSKMKSVHLLPFENICTRNKTQKIHFVRNGALSYIDEMKMQFHILSPGLIHQSFTTALCNEVTSSFGFDLGSIFVFPDQCLESTSQEPTRKLN